MPTNDTYDTNFNAADSVLIPNQGVMSMQGANPLQDGQGNWYGQVVVAQNATNTPYFTRLEDGQGATLLTVEQLTSIVNGLPVEQFGYITGGPVDSTGLPQGPSFVRDKGVVGKGRLTGTVTATVAGDTNLVFSVAPKTPQPGQAILLSAATSEMAFVSDTYVPTVSATTIPLRNPLVQAGNTAAAWDVFAITGPGTSAMTGIGLKHSVQAIWNASDGNYYQVIGALADGVARSSVPMYGNALYNNSTMDRMRGNLDNISLVASAAYTTTQTSADQTNYNGRGVIVVLDMTNVGASPSVTLEIDGKDPVSGKYYSLLTGAAVVTVSTNVYTVYPGGPATANVSANSPLPRTWRVKVTANVANSGTYSVGASVIL